MTITLLELEINSCNPCAITLDLTFVRFSTSLVFPPKNTYFPSFFITTWSPPLLNATSIALTAACNFSLLVPSSVTIPALIVTGILLPILISFITSNISNLESVKA